MDLTLALVLALAPTLTLFLTVLGCCTCGAPAGLACTTEVQSCRASGIVSPLAVPARRQQGWEGNRALTMSVPQSVPARPLRMTRQQRMLGWGGVGGMGLRMCGDIHPNPGPMRTVVVNVTSLHLHGMEVAL